MPHRDLPPPDPARVDTALTRAMFENTDSNAGLTMLLMLAMVAPYWGLVPWWYQAVPVACYAVINGLFILVRRQYDAARGDEAALPGLWTRYRRITMAAGFTWGLGGALLASSTPEAPFAIASTVVILAGIGLSSAVGRAAYRPELLRLFSDSVLGPIVLMVILLHAEAGLFIAAMVAITWVWCLRTGKSTHRQMRTLIETQLATEDYARALAADASTPRPEGRAAFTRQAEAEVSRALRNGKALSLVLFDVALVPTGPTPATDPTADLDREALVAGVIGDLRPVLRGSDVLARLDSRLYAILLPESDRFGAQVKARELQEVAERTDLGPRIVGLRAALTQGVAEFANEIVTPDGLEAAALAALTAARAAGPGTVRLYEDDVVGAHARQIV